MFIVFKALIVYFNISDTFYKMCICKFTNLNHHITKTQIDCYFLSLNTEPANILNHYFNVLEEVNKNKF